MSVLAPSVVFSRYRKVGRGWVILVCDRCKRTTKVRKDKADPRHTAIIETRCPECTGSGEFESIIYYTRSGTQIEP